MESDKREAWDEMVSKGCNKESWKVRTSTRPRRFNHPIVSLKMRKMTPGQLSCSLMTFGSASIFGFKSLKLWVLKASSNEIIKIK